MFSNSSETVRRIKVIVGDKIKIVPGFIFHDLGSKVKVTT